MKRRAGRSFFMRDHQIYMRPISFARDPHKYIVGRNERARKNVSRRDARQRRPLREKEKESRVDDRFVFIELRVAIYSFLLLFLSPRIAHAL